MRRLRMYHRSRGNDPPTCSRFDPPHKTSNTHFLAECHRSLSGDRQRCDPVSLLHPRQILHHLRFPFGRFDIGSSAAPSPFHLLCHSQPDLHRNSRSHLLRPRQGDFVFIATKGVSASHVSTSILWYGGNHCAAHLCCLQYPGHMGVEFQ